MLQNNRIVLFNELDTMYGGLEIDDVLPDVYHVRV